MIVIMVTCDCSIVNLNESIVLICSLRFDVPIRLVSLIKHSFNWLRLTVISSVGSGSLQYRSLALSQYMAALLTVNRSFRSWDSFTAV